MTTFYFVRHGEPTYAPMEERGYIGHGIDLAPLTEKGRHQLQETAKDTRLLGCELILSSPYTRALQSAAILSKELQIDIQVETDLHEWMPDLTFQYGTTQESVALCDDFNLYHGIYPPGEKKRWESDEHMRRRMLGVLERYRSLNRVIVVCHGMVIRSAMCLPWEVHIVCGEIIEFKL